MSSWCIVAIPEDRDPVWRYSSEPIPHMTLLFLGEQEGAEKAAHIAQFVEHVAKTSMWPFTMSVDRRGKLGSDDADVLFFTKDRHDKAMINQVRNYLLTDPVILTAYESIEQYPEWTPHLTMGYPKTPAKKDEREYPGFDYVHFNRLALWTSQDAGPTFTIEGRESELVDMYMSDPVSDFLEHYGVKGMRWGFRKVNGVPTPVELHAPPGQKIKATGGTYQPASTDAKKAARLKQRAKASTTDSLSDKQLKDLVNRMNLEQQYANLSTQAAARERSRAQKFINDLFGNVEKNAQQQVGNIANQQINAAIRKKFGG